MADTLEIAFALTGDDKVANAFLRFAKTSDVATASAKALTVSLNEAADAYRALNAEAAKFNRGQGGGSGPAVNIGRGVSRSAGSGQSAAIADRFTTGPFQRQEKLSEEMRRASQQGNTRAVADIGLAQGRNDRLVARAGAGPKGLGDRLADLVKTSRFSVAGGKAEIMPLVGKALGVITEALGPEILAVAGPVGLVVAAAIEASKALFELTKASAEAGASYAKFTYAIGNNGPGAANALSIGRMAGLDAAGTAGLANNVNSAITGSALGRMYGQSVGVFNQAGPYGSVNHADILTQAIEGTRGIKDFDQKVRTMNALGLQGASAAIMMPQKQYDLHQQDRTTTGGIMDKDFQDKSLAFQDSLGRVGDAFNNIMVVLGKPAIEAITNVLNNVANALNNFATFMNSPTMQFMIKSLEQYGSIIGVLTFATKPDDPHTAAQKETTQAIKEQTALMKTPGVYGRDTDGRLGKAMGSGVGFGADSRARADMMRAGYAQGAF